MQQFCTLNKVCLQQCSNYFDGQLQMNLDTYMFPHNLFPSI